MECPPLRRDPVQRPFPLKRGGFTLVELLVVLAIIAIVTAVTLAGQSAFNKTLILANTTYDIALTLRSAETYGLGSRALGSTANTGYGVEFLTSVPASFTFFRDIYPSASDPRHCHPTPAGGPSAPDAQPGNCVYDGTSRSENISTYTLGNGITVSNFCAFKSGVWLCTNKGMLSALDIVFARPDPNPFMSVDGVYSALFPVTAACLALTSPQGGSRFLSVAASGEITADAASCP